MRSSLVLTGSANDAVCLCWLQVLVHVLDLVRHGPVLGPDLGLDSVLTLLPRGEVNATH